MDLDFYEVPLPSDEALRKEQDRYARKLANNKGKPWISSDDSEEKESEGGEERRNTNHLPPKQHRSSSFCLEITQQESEYRAKELPAICGNLLDKKIACTSCGKNLRGHVVEHRKFFTHAMLGVLMCEKCSTFYGDGNFSVDEDGSDKYCRWCGDGGNLYCCSSCSLAFCRQCLKRNLNRSALKELESEDWKCLACQPQPLWELRALCAATQEYMNKTKRRHKSLNKSNLQEKCSWRKTPVKGSPDPISNSEEQAKSHKKMLEKEENFQLGSDKNISDHHVGSSKKTAIKCSSYSEDNSSPKISSRTVDDTGNGIPGSNSNDMPSVRINKSTIDSSCSEPHDRGKDSVDSSSKRRSKKHSRESQSCDKEIQSINSAADDVSLRISRKSAGKACLWLQQACKDISKVSEFTSLQSHNMHTKEMNIIKMTNLKNVTEFVSEIQFLIKCSTKNLLSISNNLKTTYNSWLRKQLKRLTTVSKEKEDISSVVSNEDQEMIVKRREPEVQRTESVREESISVNEEKGKSSVASRVNIKSVNESDIDMEDISKTKTSRTDQEDMSSSDNGESKARRVGKTNVEDSSKCNTVLPNSECNQMEVDEEYVQTVKCDNAYDHHELHAKSKDVAKKGLQSGDALSRDRTGKILGSGAGLSKDRVGEKFESDDVLSKDRVEKKLESDVLSNDQAGKKLEEVDILFKDGVRKVFESSDLLSKEKAGKKSHSSDVSKDKAGKKLESGDVLSKHRARKRLKSDAVLSKDKTGEKSENEDVLCKDRAGKKLESGDYLSKDKVEKKLERGHDLSIDRLEKKLERGDILSKDRVEEKLERYDVLSIDRLEKKLERCDDLFKDKAENEFDRVEKKVESGDVLSKVMSGRGDVSSKDDTGKTLERGNVHSKDKVMMKLGSDDVLTKDRVDKKLGSGDVPSKDKAGNMFERGDFPSKNDAGRTLKSSDVLCEKLDNEGDVTKIMDKYRVKKKEENSLLIEQNTQDLLADKGGVIEDQMGMISYSKEDLETVKLYVSPKSKPGWSKSMKVMSLVQDYGDSDEGDDSDGAETVKFPLSPKRKRSGSVMFFKDVKREEDLQEKSFQDEQVIKDKKLPANSLPHPDVCVKKEKTNIDPHLSTTYVIKTEPERASAEYIEDTLKARVASLEDSSNKLSESSAALKRKRKRRRYRKIAQKRKRGKCVFQKSNRKRRRKEDTDDNGTLDSSISDFVSSDDPVEKSVKPVMPKCKKICLESYEDVKLRSVCVVLVERMRISGVGKSFPEKNVTSRKISKDDCNSDIDRTQEEKCEAVDKLESDKTARLLNLKTVNRGPVRKSEIKSGNNSQKRQTTSGIHGVEISESDTQSPVLNFHIKSDFGDCPVGNCSDRPSDLELSYKELSDKINRIREKLSKNIYR